MADTSAESKAGMGRSTLLMIIVGVIVLALVAFLVIRPGGSSAATGVSSKPTAPVVAH